MVVVRSSCTGRQLPIVQELSSKRNSFLAVSSDSLAMRVDVARTDPPLGANKRSTRDQLVLRLEIVQCNVIRARTDEIDPVLLGVLKLELLHTNGGEFGAVFKEILVDRRVGKLMEDTSVRKQVGLQLVAMVQGVDLIVEVVLSRPGTRINDLERLEAGEMLQLFHDGVFELHDVGRWALGGGVGVNRLLNGCKLEK